MKHYRVLIDANDEKGLVYKVSKLFFSHGLNIVENHEFVDNENLKFFMRSVIEGDVDIVKLQLELKDILPKSANVEIVEPEKKNIVILVTKETHCIGDILMRYTAEELHANILAVVGNYNFLQPLVKKFNIPFHFVSHDGLSREEHAEEIAKLLKQYKLDYIVLAKYMRILPPEFVEQYENKIINIHHSFLPAFIGANPYKQAYKRGVKIIGATAHLVNNDLDEGPIISQSVVNVDHSQSWREMQQAGRDVEKIVLSNALNLALEDRIFVYDNKTVIF